MSEPASPIASADARFSPNTKSVEALVLHIGELIEISFTDHAAVDPPWISRVGESGGVTDGSISLPYNLTVAAAGRTTTELEEEIRRLYVPKYFAHLYVKVQRRPERYFFVGGEVKTPGRQSYVADMTVLQAVQAAGDLTQFANRKRIEVTRSNGQKLTVNWSKATKDPKLDLPVFPNDSIIVHRKRW